MTPSTRTARFAAPFVVAVVAGLAALLWTRLPSPPADLGLHERTVFSPGGEDGILERIFEIVEPRTRYLVDLGAGNGIEGSSSRNLILNHGWGGLLVEPRGAQAEELRRLYESNASVATHQALIDPGNIEIILERHGVPREPDLLIIGLKANDWYVWRAIRDFAPRVVQIQYNATFVPPQTMVVEYHPLNFWDGGTYFGASIQSLYNLGHKLGYELVYADSTGTDLFFVRTELYDRFGLPDNDPRVLYHPSASLPQIPPVRVRDWIGPGGEPLPPQAQELVVENVRIPRTYVFDLVERGGGS